MSEKIEKIKAQLVSFEANLNKYKELYIQSGLSEDELAKKIDQCNALLDRCMAKLEGRKPKEEVQGIEEKEVQLENISSDDVMSKIEELLAKVRSAIYS